MECPLGPAGWLRYALQMLTAHQDWDDAFANMAYIEGSEELPQYWTDCAAAYRASGVRIDQNVPYGTHPREHFDLIWPEGIPAGLVVFIHGGYWMRLDKSYWTHFAEGARSHGWAVCIPSYTLAPDARISQMTRQIACAIEAAATRVNGPIRITGHSAGGHLATRMICDDTPIKTKAQQCIVSVQSISGLHDLRPLLQTTMNKTLRLDEAEAKSESPALRRPARQIPYCTWVGSNERPEFIRQARLMADIWTGLDMPTSCVQEDGHDHFSVLEGLRHGDSKITLGLLGKHSGQ